MVVDHDDVRVGGTASRGEQEAVVIVRALEPPAEVRFGPDLVPHRPRRRIRQVGEGAVGRRPGPLRQRPELLLPLRLEERALLAGDQLEPRQADVVVPSLEERERRPPRVVGQRLGEQGQIPTDQLLLQVDGVGRHDRPLAVGPGPPDGRHEIAERLADPGAGFEQRDAALVVGVRHVRGHVALRRPVFELREGARHRPLGAEHVRRGDRIEEHVLGRLRDLDDHVELPGVVVDDAEPDAGVVQPHRHVQIGRRRLEHAARVVVQHHLAALRHPRQRQHGAHGAPRHRPHGRDDPLGDLRHERDLPAAGRGDLGGEPCLRRGRERRHVLSSRFLAAGNRTLLRIKR